MTIQIIYKGHPIGYQLIVRSNFTSQKRVAQDISRADRNLQPRILYPARLLFRVEGEIVSQTSKN